MARSRLPVSTVCARFTAFFLGLALLGFVADWFEDGAVGVVSIVVSAASGLALTVAAHRLSKQRV